jgi:hypothetical protein
MGLAVQFGKLRTVEAPASWYVYANHFPKVRGDAGSAFVWGFARKTDAEIAMRVMPLTGINWNLTKDELRPQWEAYGGREAVMKFVCEHLQW